MAKKKPLSSDIFGMPPAGTQTVPKPADWKAPYLHQPITTLAPTFKEGDIINGQYEVKELCHGGMGVVFHCYDRVAKLDVAVKTLIDERKLERSRVYAFYEEVQKRVQLDPHPNVVRFRLVELIHGYPYIVSEWIEGHDRYGNSLESWMERHRFTLEEIVDFLQQICAGLGHCSSRLSTVDEPFVLGDLKPENILVTKDQVFKLADFSTHSYTKGWESPEQLQNKRLDERSDIYTLGLMALGLLGMAEQTGEKERLASKLKDLIGFCLKDDIQARMPSLEALNASLETLCEEAGLPQYKAKVTARRKSFLDSIYKLHSEINLGMPPKSTASLSDQSWIISGGMFQGGVEEFAEYARIPDRYTYEAEAALSMGDVKKALKILSQNHDCQGWESSPRHLYIRGLAYLHQRDLNRAIEDLDAASKTELFLPALDAKADILLQNPELLCEQTHMEHIKEDLERFFSAFYDNSNGYLSNQIYGKYLMLTGEYAFASRAFQESLFYPNAAEWNNLYYYGVCEYRQKNIYKAIAIFSSATQVIASDPDYMADCKKAATLLLCWFALAKEEETQQLVTAIGSKYGFDYQYLLDSLRRDLQVYKEYRDLLQDAEIRSQGDPESLQGSLHALMDSLERERPIEHAFLMGDMANAICSRETALLFQKQQYNEGAAVCDRALAYDSCHPAALKNKGACFLMAGNYSLAEACYRLSFFYEQDPQIRQEIKAVLDGIHGERPEAFPGPDV